MYFTVREEASVIAMVITDFPISFQKQEIYSMLHAKDNQELMQQYEEVFDELAEKLYEIVKPRALLQIGYDEAVKKEVLYEIVTIGVAGEQYVEALFAEESYTKGLLCDMMLNNYLFQIPDYLADQKKQLCCECGYGMVKKIEAPIQLSSLELQKVLTLLKAKETLQVETLPSGMLKPVKSMCQMYVLQMGNYGEMMTHSCKNCPNKTCMLRRNV